MTDDTITRHEYVTTLEELDALDEDEMLMGYRSAEKGDPEPGANHTRSFHHGWRMRMIDHNELPSTPEHRELVRQWLARERRTQQGNSK